MSEARQVDGELFLKGEQIPDLRVLGPAARRRLHQVPVDTGLGVGLDAGQVQWRHGVTAGTSLRT
jgi:hypothetical protein